jgi:hypothetical protein
MAEGQSGAGAEVTALAESLQAYACATRQFLKRPLTDVSEITETTTKDAICDRKLKDALKGLNANWYHSVITTANEIFKDVKPSSKYIFYRGGDFVNSIYDEWRVHKNGSGITGDDKWNPADIWMVKSNFKLKTDWPTLRDYNRYLYDEFANKNLIGISLKLVPKGDAHSKIFNDGKPLVAQWRGYKLGENMFDSKDIYLQFTSEGKEGEIQLRNFSSQATTSSWQGEIKGKSAAGGKIGGGIVMTAALESGISRSKLMIPNSFQQYINRPNDQILKKFATMFKELSGSRKSIADLQKEAMMYAKKDPTWWMSKFLGVHYVYTILNEKKENDVVKWLFEYGSSATKNSSIFIKYS